jgi:peptidyl-prolyl cis-trans isomerase D
MVVPFNNACFSGEKGDLKTAETTYGIHVIQILDQSKKVKKYNVGIVDRKVIPGSLTNQAVYSEASQFAGTNDTYEKFNKAVAEKGLNKRVATDIAPQQKTLPGLENPRYLIMSLFQATPGKIVLDNNSQAVFEVDNKYVVAYCTKAQEEGIAPLKDVENDIRFALVKEKKGEIISKEFESKSSGKSLDQLATEMSLPVQEATQVNYKSYTVAGAGTEPALVAASTAAPQGKLSGPVEGINGVFMLVVNNITPAQAEEVSAVKKRLQSTFEVRGTYEAYEALRKKANIVDKRYKFY